MTGHFLTPHAVYEAEHPDEAEMAARYAQDREAAHLRAHGTLDGYSPEREFPCTGSLRVVERDATGIDTWACDACRFVTTARTRSPGREPDPEPDRTPAPF